MNIEKFLRLLVAIVVCNSAGWIGALYTTTGVNSWYETIVKSTLTPPNWVFGPVWTILYTLMGVAVWLVWEKRTAVTGAGKALAVFGVHLVVNALWSIVFFGFERPGSALVIIVALLVLLVISMKLFYRIDRRAMYILVPYLAWGMFATYLNAFIVLNN